MNRQNLIFVSVCIVGLFPMFRSTFGNKRQAGRLYIIGTGPAGPHMATLQALETMKRVDAIVAPDDHLKLFEEYVGDKPVLFDPWEGLFDYQGKSMRELTPTERVQFIEERDRSME